MSDCRRQGHSWNHRAYEGIWLCHCTECGIVPNRAGRAVQDDGLPTFDVERLAGALYEQSRASYRDPRRAPPPWDVITTRSRNTEWKPQGGSRVEHYGSLADSYRSSARGLISFYRRAAPPLHERSQDPPK